MNALNRCKQQNWPRIHFDIMSIAIETNNEWVPEQLSVVWVILYVE